MHGINRHMLHEMGDNDRWGDAETYDHTRRPAKGTWGFGKIEMAHAEHLPIEVIDLGERIISLEMKR